jgi:hypothetical protein
LEFRISNFEFIGQPEAIRNPKFEIPKREGRASYSFGPNGVSGKDNAKMREQLTSLTGLLPGELSPI